MAFVSVCQTDMLHKEVGSKLVCRAMKAFGCFSVGKHSCSHQKLYILEAHVAQSVVPSKKFFLCWTEVEIRVMNGLDRVGQATGGLVGSLILVGV